MNDLIGETAGRLYTVIEDNGGKAIPLDALRRSVGGRTVVFHMAIGWLAREDKLTFSTRGRTAMVALNDSIL